MRQGIFDAMMIMLLLGGIAGMITGVLLAMNVDILIGSIIIVISLVTWTFVMIFANYQVSGPTFSKRQIRKMNKEMGKLKEKDNEDGCIEGEKSYNRYG